MPHVEPYPLYRVRQKSSTKQHGLTHLPCRSWCRHCVRAKDKDSQHHGSSPGGVSKFATNYIVMGEDGTPITVPAGYDELTKTLFPNAVCCKDTSSLYAETTLATNVWSWAFLCLAHGGTTTSDLVRP